MFPIEFAFDIVEQYCPLGGMVLDPFAGRATSTFAAAALKRKGYGIEINPVGWLYGKVKLYPATKADVIKRIEELESLSKQLDDNIVNDMSEFFHICYANKVLRYLLAAREHLNWKSNMIDATLMAIILVHLHGKIQNNLSNQMRQGKAMSPDYSVKWWKQRENTPPNLDPVAFLKKKMEWRYAKGSPSFECGEVHLGDSTVHLKELDNKLTDGCDLLFTSPPYYAVTDYHYDQWLRLWMLGGPNHPVHIGGNSTGRFASKVAYTELICNVFKDCASLMNAGGTVYVRTDRREFTFDTTLTALKEIFNSSDPEIIMRPYIKKTQTALYGDDTSKPGEVDIILKIKASK